MNEPEHTAKENSPYYYWAFISHSSKDAKWARWLHRSIEAYGIPAEFVTHPTPTGEPAPKRFHPAFHYRTDIAASPNLRERIKDALRDSRFLIVVCSPQAAQCAWVNKEIADFQALGRENYVLAVVVSGEPNSGGSQECFPPVLRRGDHSPGAPDVRADGKRNAKLRLLAGMLGVSFDALKNRDAHRQIRRLQFAVATASLVLFSLAVMAWYSNYQRDKAVKARQQAEGIMNYMLYDLRDKLEPVGRLDIVRDVQKRVDEYYRVLGVEKSDTNSLRNRATAFCDEGDIFFAQGDLTGALRAYQEFQARIQMLAAVDPSNAVWQSDLSVSQIKIGDLLQAQSDLPGALKAYRESLAIVERLAAADPSNPRWERDISVGDNNIGTVLLRQRNLDGALEVFRESLKIREELAKANPSNTEWKHGLCVSQHLVGDVLMAQGDLAGAYDNYRKSLTVIQQLAAIDPSNAGWQRDISVIYDKLGDVLEALSNIGEALQDYRAALAIRQRLVTSDPSNADWQRDLIASYWRVAEAIEKSGTGDPLEWWRKAYELLSRMKQLGLMRQSDEFQLEQLRQKTGVR